MHFLLTLLTITELSQYPMNENEDIEVRGFLHQNAQGEVFLAEQPNLPSCCIGHKGFQIKVLNVEKVNPHRVSLIKGKLKKLDKIWVLESNKS